MTVRTRPSDPLQRAALLACLVLAVVGLAAVGLPAVTEPAAFAAERTADPTPGPPAPVFGLRAGLSGRTTLESDHFTYAMTAGGIVADSIDVVNHQDRPVTVSLYGADLVEASGGALSPAQADEPKTSAGAWIEPATARLTVAGGESERVPFIVRVPDGVAPGEYLGAVVGSAMLGRTPNGLGVQVRVSLQVRVRVPGVAHPGLSLETPVSLPHDRIAVTVHNTGNVLLTLDGRLRVGGRAVALTPNDVYVIPGGSSTLVARWSERPFLGAADVRAAVTASRDGSPVATVQSPALHLVFVPWPALLAVLAVLVLALAAWLLSRPARARRAQRRLWERGVIARARAELNPMNPVVDPPGRT